MHCQHQNAGKCYPCNTMVLTMKRQPFGEVTLENGVTLFRRFRSSHGVFENCSKPVQFNAPRMDLLAALDRAGIKVSFPWFASLASHLR